jgi:hypothetical protein
VTQSATISRDRLTVKTTWQLNIDYICQESMSEGIGTAAKTVMVFVLDKTGSRFHEINPFYVI